MTSPNDDRAALITGLRGLADFLATHPDVPVPPGYHETIVHVFPGGQSDAERCAEVDRVAAVLGTPAADPDHCGHYATDRTFGPVTYRVLAISDAHRADYHAQMSYFGAVAA
jgi:hypothetical protein